VTVAGMTNYPPCIKPAQGWPTLLFSIQDDVSIAGGTGHGFP
jgi:hypothetical protein